MSGDGRGGPGEIAGQRRYRTCLALEGSDLAVFVQGDTAQLTIVLGEMDQRHDDVIFGHPVGGQSGGQVIDLAELAPDRDRPGLAADADSLRDLDGLAWL